MTFETLSRGNSLHCQIIDTGNDIRKLQEWIEELKKDAVVEIRSNDNPEQSIIVLHGTEVLHLVEQRLGELKEHLKEMESEFNAL